MEEVEKRIQSAIEIQSYDAVIAVGVDNFIYVSGVVLPFAHYYPDRQAVVIKTKDGQNCILCPFDWSEAIRDQGWKGEVVTYDENKGVPPKAIIEALAKVISQLGVDKGRVGLDRFRTSKFFMDLLERRLPDVFWVPFDGVLRDLRILKTQGEIELLETASIQSEKGIITALMHLEGTVDLPGYTVSEFSERVRVHVFEFGGSGVGHVATMQGSDAQMFYSPQRGKIHSCEFIRIDVTNHYQGYWSNAGRMAVTGEPTAKQTVSYKDNLLLKTSAENMIRPGVRCNDIFGEVVKTAEREGIMFWEEVGIGHGVGVSHREAPYLDRYDRTILKPGMVLVLDIYTYGPRRELLHSKDTYEVVKGGSRLLSWFRSWDKLYVVRGFRTTH